MSRYKSKDFCEGEKLPRTSQLSISITKDQKKDLIKNAHKKGKSVSRLVRDILKTQKAI